MLPTARVTDITVSLATYGSPVPIIPPGAPTVLIEGFPAARVGDGCGVDVIALGSTTVIFEGMPDARVADATVAGGAILPLGAATALIGG